LAMTQIGFKFLAVMMGIVSVAQVSSAQSNFYEGKTIRIIVGFSPGGGYDALARMLSRHMPKYIPGHPTILVENMTGAGSLLAANHIFKVAKPDGLTFGHFSGGFAYSQVMGQPGIEFDVRKFVFLGAVARDESAIALTKASGITNMDQWFAAKTPVKLGTTGPGAFGTDNVVKVVKAALNLPIQVISGYKGTADMRLAAESGEIDGTTWGWDSMRGTWMPQSRILSLYWTSSPRSVRPCTVSRRGFSGVLLGSETHKVLTHSELPVLVLR